MNKSGILPAITTFVRQTDTGGMVYALLHRSGIWLGETKAEKIQFCWAFTKHPFVSTPIHFPFFSFKDTFRVK